VMLRRHSVIWYLATRAGSETLCVWAEDGAFDGNLIRQDN